MSDSTPLGLEVELALASDVGRLRERNEDAVAGNAERRWALVADGMGGHQGGDVAAAIVASTLSALLEVLMNPLPGVEALSDGLRSAMQDANRKVFERGQSDPLLIGMGSTAVVACVAETTLVIGHVGDSRGYLFRDGALEQITQDHSLLQELLDGGMITAAEARRSPGRGVLTRSMGVGPGVDVDVASVPLRPGDLVLLCSDGLTEMVGDAVITEVLRTPGESLATLASRLIARANAGGGRDNVSVALLSVKQVAAV